MSTPHKSAGSCGIQNNRHNNRQNISGFLHVLFKSPVTCSKGKPLNKKRRIRSWSFNLSSLIHLIPLFLETTSRYVCQITRVQDKSNILFNRVLLILLFKSVNRKKHKPQMCAVWGNAGWSHGMHGLHVTQHLHKCCWFKMQIIKFMQITHRHIDYNNYYMKECPTIQCLKICSHYYYYIM